MSKADKFDLWTITQSRHQVTTKSSRKSFTQECARVVRLHFGAKSASRSPFKDLHTARGTASGVDGQPITKIKLPHLGGHEGVGRIVAVGEGVKPIDDDIRVGALVGIRFASRVCQRCEFCMAGIEQYCPRSTNHLHHEDGAFQEFVVLDAGYITLLPDDVDVVTTGPTLCAGVTAYKVCKKTSKRCFHG